MAPYKNAGKTKIVNLTSLLLITHFPISILSIHIACLSLGHFSHPLIPSLRITPPHFIFILQPFPINRWSFQNNLFFLFVKLYFGHKVLVIVLPHMSRSIFIFIAFSILFVRLNILKLYLWYLETNLFFF